MQPRLAGQSLDESRRQVKLWAGAQQTKGTAHPTLYVMDDDLRAEDQ